MSGFGAIALLALARVRRTKGRWLLTVAGLAAATAFAGSVAAESTVAGDQAARSTLAGLTPLARAIRVSWQELVTPEVERRARRLIDGLGLVERSEVVLLNPVRLGGVVVHPAAIAPLSSWIAPGSPRVGPCRARRCPMLLSARLRARILSVQGLAVPIAGVATLRSAAPLGFVPYQPTDQPPVALTGDLTGLERVPALGGVFRTHSWVGELPIAQLHAWQLGATERRLQQAQAALEASDSGYTVTAPFAGLDAARAAASTAPHRLLLLAGGALAALALFVVLAAGGIRSDLEADLRRLEVAGASNAQCIWLVVVESALLCAVAVLLGAVIAASMAIPLSAGAGLPVGGVLAHSLATPVAAVVLVAGWLLATTLISLLLLVRGQVLGELAAVAAVAALAVILTRGAGGSDPIAVLLAPLCCVAAGVIVARAAVALLRGGERVARNGPVSARLAFVGLARAPGAPSLTIAFIAVSIGLGAFALSYRATLLRGAADQAADQVPLDATVSQGSDFVSPVELASGTRWEALSGGAVAAVRRTEASFVGGASSVTVPALGVPAAAIPRLHGWREGDATPALRVAARRLVGPRAHAVRLAQGAVGLRVHAVSTGVAVSLTADFLDRDDRLVQVPLGTAASRPRTLSVRLPSVLRGGGWRIAGLGLQEPAGLQITNGHQNAENVAAQTQFSGDVRLGPLTLTGRGHAPMQQLSLSGWWAVGAARAFAPTRSDQTSLRFETSGEPGLLRPRAPSDGAPLPVLVDPQTAGAAASGGLIALTVDGVPVRAKVVGVLRRFPTVPSGAAGFVVADQQTLASALDAQLPGQGRADELWISDARPQRLQATLRRPPFTQLSFSLRAAIEHQLRSAPVAVAVLRTLLAAAAVSGLLALVGLLVTLLGPGRDRRGEDDLLASGIGPGALRAQLTLRLVVSAASGVAVGFAIGLLLTRLVVATVHAAGASANPVPPLETIVPWGAMALAALAALTALAGAGWAAVRVMAGRTA